MKKTGRLSWNAKGYAFVACQDGLDVFVPPGKMGTALDGDLVEVSAERDAKGLRGRVLSVLERAPLTVSGRYRRQKRWGVLEPHRPLPYPVIIPHGSQGNARSGDLVMATVDPPKKNKRITTLNARVEYTQNLPEDIGEDLRMIAVEHGLPWLFPPEVEHEAGRVSRIDLPAHLKRRHDLRERVLFTIDGADARDFDDAVGLERLDDGTLLLTVAIADVAEFVRPAGPLDQEAYRRCFSVYFPELCIPMLPETLANGSCSLRPRRDRLAMVVEIRLGPRGRYIGASCCEAVIRSNARLTYDQVNGFFRGESLGVDDPRVGEQLTRLHRVTRGLAAQRRRKGSLDFDLPEVRISLDDQGEVAGIVRRERGDAERLIEECMLLANRAVCRWLGERGAPVLYRVHEPPELEKLLELVATLRLVGVDPATVANLETAANRERGVHRALQQVVDAVQGSDLEKFVNYQVLRALKQACYEPEDTGHFGLAFRGYVHFTSPIRRYSDLVTHRLVKQSLAREYTGRDLRKWKGYLKTAAPHITRRERVTNEAMSDVVRHKTAAFLAEHLGETFDGVVTGIRPFGVFVELTEVPVSGMIPAEVLGRARIDEGRRVRMKGREILIGARIAVRISRVDRERGFVDLSLADNAATCVS